MSYITMPQEGTIAFMVSTGFTCEDSKEVIEMLGIAPKEQYQEYVKGNPEFACASSEMDSYLGFDIKWYTRKVLFKYTNCFSIVPTVVNISLCGNDDSGYSVTVTFYVEVGTESTVYSNSLKRENLEQLESDLVRAFPTDWQFANA